MPERGIAHSLIRRILASSHYFIAFAVLGSFLSTVVLMVFSTLLVANITLDAIFNKELNEETTKHPSVQFIELIEVILLATVLYIVALGLYKLFIEDRLPLPTWLWINSLDNLKDKVVSVVIVLLRVHFLGAVVNWDGSRTIIYYGGAISHRQRVLPPARITSDANDATPDAPVVPAETPPPDDGSV